MAIWLTQSVNPTQRVGQYAEGILPLNAHTDEYLRILKEFDEKEDADGEPDEGVEALTRENVEERLKAARERLAKYECYQKMMEETVASQLSLTDADARLMKSKNGFMVSYNPQVAVDSETHLNRDFEMTNRVTDHGMLEGTMKGLREETPGGVLEAVADRGDESVDDMAACLDNGIIPHVIPEEGKDGYAIEIAYEEAEADSSGTEPEELRKCLHAGIVPDAYREVIKNITVKEVRRKVRKEDGEDGRRKSIYGTPEEMEERARQGYFVRDPERNLVYCPAGEILRQKSIKKNESIRYANKNACKHCKNRNKCYKGKGEWKEIDFTKDTLEKPCRDWLAAEDKASAMPKPSVRERFEKLKVVQFILKPDRRKMSSRLCLSEHPFGTIERAMGAAYFLLRGMEKVAGEFALFCLGYNIERAKNLLGFRKMMEIMAGE